MSAGEAEQEAEALWSFAVDVYAVPGVEAACLALQDEHGLDVPLLLTCLFLARRGAGLREEGLGPLMRLSTAWSTTVVAPLRAIRRRLKHEAVGAIDPEAAAATRKAVQAAELEAERAQLVMLFRSLAVTPGRDGREANRAGVARSTLARYAHMAGADPAGPARAALEILVGAAFPIPVEEHRSGH